MFSIVIADVQAWRRNDICLAIVVFLGLFLMCRPKGMDGDRYGEEVSGSREAVWQSYRATILNNM